jgi:hypothetical protein
MKKDDQILIGVLAVLAFLALRSSIAASQTSMWSGAFSWLNPKPKSSPPP